MHGRVSRPCSRPIKAVEADARSSTTRCAQVIDRLTGGHGFQVSDADKAGITRIMQAFRTAGPKREGIGRQESDLRPGDDGYGSEGKLSRATWRPKRISGSCRRSSGAISIVPVVGDFAGDKALASDRPLSRRARRDRRRLLRVERRALPLRSGRSAQRFYANVARLPPDPSSTFIRSVTRDISRRLGFPLPEGDSNWWSSLFSDTRLSRRVHQRPARDLPATLRGRPVATVVLQAIIRSPSPPRSPTPSGLERPFVSKASR